MWERIYLAKFAVVVMFLASLYNVYKILTVTDPLLRIAYVYFFVFVFTIAIGFELYVMHIKHRYHRTLKREKPQWKSGKR